MELWNIQRDWEGETCAILGAGPSMSLKIAEKIRGNCRTIAVNGQAIKMANAQGIVHEAIAPWADILYAADKKWWSVNAEEAAKFKGIKVSIMPNGYMDFNTIIDDIRMLGWGGRAGFDDRPNHIMTGWNSGYQAVHIAAHLGAKRILLCGFDMRGTHWFGDHSWRPGYTSRHSLFIQGFIYGAPEFEKRGIQVLNCTPGSALKCFPMVSLEEGLYGVQELRRTPKVFSGTYAPGIRGTRQNAKSIKEEA